MKIKRHKRFERHMKFFEKNFKFRQPYQILLDGTFAQAALKNKVNLKEQLPKFFGGPVKLLTTPCVLLEVEWLGPDVYGALQILKQFGIHQCSHGSKTSVDGSKCLISMISPQNDSRYVIATQDHELKLQAGNIPGVPFLYLHGNSPTLEKPSEASSTAANVANTTKLKIADYQKEALDTLKQDCINEPVTKRGTKKKRPKGPNPLSCKKKKIISHSSTNTSSMTKKRQRIRIKVPKHVKEVRSKSAETQSR